MLLRSLTKHVKDQNWFAVALDFIVVVVGILIAFQISSIAEKQGEAAKFDRQLQAVKIEMIENFDRFELKLHQIDAQFEDIAELRKILGGPARESTDQHIDFLLMRAIGVIGIYAKRNALDAALSSELFGDLDEPELMDEIEDWAQKLANLNRVQQDALHFRDGFVHAHFSENIAYASVFASAPIAQNKITPSRTGNVRVELADDKILENILAGRQLSVLQDISYTKELVEHTREIIRLIDSRGAAP